MKIKLSHFGVGFLSLAMLGASSHIYASIPVQNKAQACKPYPMAHTNHQAGSMILKKSKKLNLNPDQIARIQAIQTANQPLMKTYHQQLRNNHNQIRQALKDPVFDGQRVQAIAEARGQLIKDMTMQKAQMRHDVMGVLTDAQSQMIFNERQKRLRQHKSNQQI